MATPTRSLRVPDEQWNRWVAVAARHIPTDGSTAIKAFIAQSMDWVCDLIEQRAAELHPASNGLVVPAQARERIVVATPDELTARSLEKDIALNGTNFVYGPPREFFPDWLERYVPMGPPAT